MAEPGTAQPFQEPGEGKLFYAHPELLQRLNLLHHLVEYSHLLLVVTAPAGGGKTTLLNRLLAEAQPPWHASVLDAHAEMAPDELGRSVLRGFDISNLPGAEADPERELIFRLGAFYGDGRNTVILVDDAHLLPRPSLQLLSRLAADEELAHVRVLLFGEPLLREASHSLHDGGHLDGISHVIELPPLSREQVRDYLYMRLHNSGFVGANPFTDPVVEKLARNSAGLPGAVNRLAADMLDTATVAPAPTTQPTHSGGESRRALPQQLLGLFSRHPWRWATGLAALLLISIALQLPDSQQAPPTTDHRIIDVPIPEAGRTRNPSYEPVAQAEEPDSPAKVIPLLAEPAPAPAADRPPAPLVPTTEPQTADTTSLPAARIEPKPISAKPTPAIAAPTPALRLKPIEPPDAPPAAPATSLPKTRSTLKDQAWLLALDPAHYTLQLTGTHSQDAALSFVREHRLVGKAAWFRTRHQGKEWFVVVMGDYPDRDAAASAREALPKRLKRLRPWPRALGGVQEAIRLAG